MSAIHRKFCKFLFTSAAVIALAGLHGCSAPGNTVGSKAQADSGLALPSNEFTLYAAGDIADCKNLIPADSEAARTAALIAAGLTGNPNAAALTLGDNTYPVGLPIEFTNCYEPTWGRFKARTYPAPGNHDYYTAAAIGYYGYFGAAAGPARRGYYSVDLGQWHVISINSNLKPPEHQAQLEWLKTDLAQHKPRCTLAFWHHPVYSSGGHGNNPHMQDVWQALYVADADVVLVSHDHNYERFAPQDDNGKRDDARGIREFVVGTGGAKLTPLGWPKSNSEVSDNATYGVLKLVLKENGYAWEFLPTAAGGFTDRGTALCH